MLLVLGYNSFDDFIESEKNDPMEIEEVIKYLDKIKIKIPFENNAFENDTSLVNNLVGNYIGYFYSLEKRMIRMIL
ncbi:MAG: hypothetical protein NZ521_03095 [Flammeovirgaceae bacterium]|nr:hypothetical protein [Flammeovirgaceae bacterium]MDW8287138.1 hypothetical protein [Flammeovirgaceae bacterium]